ncbi:MAG: hypothetical protein R3E79_55525 [Caldilineaceae bacterium]
MDGEKQGKRAPQAIVAVTQSSTGLFAEEVTTVKHRARQAVSAMRTIDNRLRLYSWRVNADGAVLRTGSSSSQTSAVQQVQLVHARNYVVACRTNDGELHLSRWDVSNTGAIYPAGESNLCARQVQWVEMVALTPDQIATLALSQTGAWQLMLWQLQGDDGLTQLEMAEIPAAPVSSCGLTVLPVAGDTARLAMIVSETPGRLSLHLWHYQAETGLTLVASPSIAFPEAAAIMATAVDPDHLHVLVQTVTGQVQLLTWQLPADGQTPFCKTVTLLREDVGHCTWQKQQDGFVLTYRTLTGEVGVQAWQTTTDGQVTLMGAGSVPTISAGEVLCCEEPLEGNAPLLTGAIGQNGEVTLLTWRTL